MLSEPRWWNPANLTFPESNPRIPKPRQGPTRVDQQETRGLHSRHHHGNYQSVLGNQTRNNDDIDGRPGQEVERKTRRIPRLQKNRC